MAGESDRILLGLAPSKESYSKTSGGPHKHKLVVSADMMVAVVRLTMQAVGDSAVSLASSHLSDGRGDDHGVRSDFHRYH